MTTAPSSSSHILLVDDELATLNLLRELFQAEGITTTLARSAAEARTALATANWEFDLVLTDIAMPGESGFDLLKWIKGPDSKDPDMPVLLVTAQLPEPRYRILGLSLGAVDYVVRPVELSELVIRALHAITYHKQVRFLQSSLEDSENTALVGRLLAASNHEIKNMAGVVGVAAGGLSRALAPYLAKDPQLAMYLNSLTSAASLLTDVAKESTQMLKDSEPHLEALRLDPILTSMIELLIPRVKPCLLRYASEQDAASLADLSVKAHPMYIKQILINLILNAHDAIQELAPDEGGLIRLSLHCDEKHVRIGVHDNGIGLKEAGTITSFAAFASTKSLRGGQGLGLWLSSRLAEKMGGTLSLQSEGPAQGTTAQLCLNRCPPPQKVDLSAYFAF